MNRDAPVGSPGVDHIEYQFVGYLLPATWAVSIHDVTSVPFRRTGDQRQRLMTFSAANGVLSAACRAPRGADVVALRNNCEHAIRLVVATYAFVDRASFDLRLTGFATSEDARAFDTRFGTLPPARVDKPELQRICNQEPRLRQALIEFSSGIASPLDTPFHAFRGIEIIRDCVAPDTDGDAASAWDQMPDQLGTSKALFSTVTQLSIAARHKGLEYVSADERLACLGALAEAIERFVEWAARGRNQPLPPASLPVLGGG